jgi:hypothetical protein
MREFLPQESHEVVLCAALEMKYVCAHEGRVVRGDGADRGFEP